LCKISSYKLLQTKLLDGLDVSKLVPLTENSDYDFWTRPRPGKQVEIMVAPENANELWNLLNALNLEPTQLVDDISKQVINLNARTAI